MVFFERLESLRLKRELSRNKLCSELGVGKNSIANWEQRGNIPDGEVLTRIATLFEVTTDYLLGRTDDPHIVIYPADPDKVREHEEEMRQNREAFYSKLESEIDRAAAKRRPPEPANVSVANLIDLVQDLSEDEASKVAEYAQLLKRVRNQ